MQKSNFEVPEYSSIISVINNIAEMSNKLTQGFYVRIFFCLCFNMQTGGNLAVSF